MDGRLRVTLLRPTDPIESPSPVAVRGVCRRRLAAELNHHELVMVTRRRPEPEPEACFGCVVCVCGALLLHTRSGNTSWQFWAGIS
jgi:hypothetical protein